MIVEVVMDFFGQGSVPKRARLEVKALVTAGYEVTVITTESPTDLKNYFLDTLPAGKFQLIQVSTLNLFRGPLRRLKRQFSAVQRELFFAVRCYQALTRLSRNNFIDLIVSHGSTSCYAVGQFSKKQKIITVFVIHGLIWDRIQASAIPYTWSLTQLYKHANRYGLSQMEYSIGVSNHIRDLAINKGARPEKTLVFYNPVDTEIFFKRDSDISLLDIDVLFVGRLSPEKGLKFLMEAAQYLPSATRIVIIGDGKLREQLEQQAHQSTCTIELKGWVDNQLLPKYLERSKVFVLPSLSEQGVVVLEAMACGVPVIGSNIGGIPEMIRHGENGWLVPSKDAIALADTIKMVLSDEALRTQAAASALATAQSFSLEWFDQQLPRFYQQLTTGNQQ